MEPPRYVCNECGRSYKAVETLNRHRKNHSSTVQYSCNTCPSTFKRKDLLDRHQQIHINEASTWTRQRSHRACLRCSRLKVRCDNQAPCTRCVKGDHECQYKEDRNRARTDRSSVDRSSSVSVCSEGSPSPGYISSPGYVSSPPLEQQTWTPDLIHPVVDPLIAAQTWPVDETWRDMWSMDQTWSQIDPNLQMGAMAVAGPSTYTTSQLHQTANLYPSHHQQNAQNSESDATNSYTAPEHFHQCTAQFGQSSMPQYTDFADIAISDACLRRHSDDTTYGSQIGAGDCMWTLSHPTSNVLEAESHAHSPRGSSMSRTPSCIDELAGLPSMPCWQQI